MSETETPKRLKDKRNADATIGIEGFVGQDIVVKSFQILDSQYAPGTTYAVIEADTSNGLGVRIRCGAAPILKALKENEAEMPYIVEVRKLGRTYILE